MTERLKKAVAGIAALVALALGGAALAQAGDSGGTANGGQAQERSDDGDRGESKTESGDESVTGSGADKAKAAALKITGGGTANAVERDNENGAVWEVEITKADGQTVDVRLDQGYGLVVVDDDSE